MKSKRRKNALITESSSPPPCNSNHLSKKRKRCIDTSLDGSDLPTIKPYIRKPKKLRKLNTGSSAVSKKSRKVTQSKRKKELVTREVQTDPVVICSDPLIHNYTIPSQPSYSSTPKPATLDPELPGILRSGMDAGNGNLNANGLDGHLGPTLSEITEWLQEQTSFSHNTNCVTGGTGMSVGSVSFMSENHGTPLIAPVTPKSSLHIGSNMPPNGADHMSVGSVSFMSENHVAPLIAPVTPKSSLQAQPKILQNGADMSVGSSMNENHGVPIIVPETPKSSLHAGSNMPPSGARLSSGTRLTDNLQSKSDPSEPIYLRDYQIEKIKSDSSSAPNFGVNLAREIYSQNERFDRNKNISGFPKATTKPYSPKQRRYMFIKEQIRKYYPEFYRVNREAHCERKIKQAIHDGFRQDAMKAAAN